MIVKYVINRQDVDVHPAIFLLKIHKNIVIYKRKR